MNRRDVFRIGAVAAAAPAAHLAAMPQAGAASWKARALDPHQVRTITLLADLIMPDTDTPGAVKAGVVQHLDTLLADGDPERRGELLASLAWIDGYAIREHHKPLADLTPAQQTGILDELDHGVSEDGRLGRSHFRAIKGAIAGIYYATESGFRELNKGGRVPKSYGCTHPEHA
ncbi:MAG: gluconate 2-dehydrogenase subunit 3 family protein [Bryobacteraceae bacterium]